MSHPVDRFTRAWRYAAIASAAVWGLSLVLPVYHNGFLAPPGHPGTGFLFGWWVAVCAPLLLSPSVSVPWLANLAGVAGIAWIARRGRPPPGLPTIAMLVAASLFIWWRPFSPHAQFHAEELLIGCWVWLGSFAPLAAVDLATLWKRPSIAAR